MSSDSIHPLCDLCTNKYCTTNVFFKKKYKMVQKLYYTGGLRTLTRPSPRKRGPSSAFDCRQSRIVPLTSRIRHVRPTISFRQPPLPVDIRPDPGTPGLLPHSGGWERYFYHNYVWQTRGGLAEFRGPLAQRNYAVDRAVLRSHSKLDSLAVILLCTAAYMS